jgi:type IV secretion system protein VirB6
MAVSFTSLFPSLSTLQVLINMEGALQTAQTAMSSYAQNVSTAIGPLVKVSLTLYVLLYGFALMRGVVKEPLNDAGIRIFKITAVISFALNFAQYNKTIALFFWGLPEDMVNWLTPSALMTFIQSIIPAGPTTSTDISIMLVSTLLSAVVEIMHLSLLAGNVGGQTDPTAFAAGLGVGVAGAGISAVVAGTLLVTKISLSVLLAVGPFFMISILFERTKQYFEGWLTQVINYVLVVFLLTLTINLIFPILLITVSSYYLIAELAGGLTLQESVELMILLGIFLAVIRQVPTTVAAIVRGYAINAPGERNMVANGAFSNQSQGKSRAQVQQEQQNVQR